jgi:hypothetical protein
MSQVLVGAIVSTYNDQIRMVKSDRYFIVKLLISYYIITVGHLKNSLLVIVISYVL